MELFFAAPDVVGDGFEVGAQVCDLVGVGVLPWRLRSKKDACSTTTSWRPPDLVDRAWSAKSADVLLARGNRLRAEVEQVPSCSLRVARGLLARKVGGHLRRLTADRSVPSPDEQSADL